MFKPTYLWETYLVVHTARCCFAPKKRLKIIFEMNMVFNNTQLEKYISSHNLTVGYETANRQKYECRDFCFKSSNVLCAPLVTHLPLRTSPVHEYYIRPNFPLHSVCCYAGLTRIFISDLSPLPTQRLSLTHTNHTVCPVMVSYTHPLALFPSLTHTEKDT